MENLSAILENKDHFFRLVIFKCELLKLVVEVANYRIRKEGGELATDTKRKRTLFLQFTQLLVENVSNSRSIDFYADKLCISPQYLSRIVKEVSGKTVYHWISDTLLDKIVSLMNNTDLSIMQIADQLNFSDQASLNKFFKKNIGLPPTSIERA